MHLRYSFNGLDVVEGDAEQFEVMELDIFDVVDDPFALVLNFIYSICTHY